MSGADWKNLRVLVVDDHPNMRKIVRTILREFGIHHVEDVATGAEMFEALGRATTDVVVLDYRLEGENGIDLVRKVREGIGIPNPFIPIIMLTSYAERSVVAGARDAGATEFLIKPLVPAKLFQRLQFVIENPRPFVRTKNFFGPDRRRQVGAFYEGAERRQEPVTAI